MTNSIFIMSFVVFILKIMYCRYFFKLNILTRSSPAFFFSHTKKLVNKKVPSVTYKIERRQGGFFFMKVKKYYVKSSLISSIGVKLIYLFHANQDNLIE